MFRNKYDQGEEESLDFSKLDPGLDSEGSIRPLPGKLSVLLNRLLSVLKLFLGLTFLAFVYAGSNGFFKEFNLADRYLKNCFWWGLCGFIIAHFFIFETGILYQKGQKILSFVFKFFAPLVKVAPYVLPIYTVLIFASYPVFKIFWPSKDVAGVFVFLGGFSWALHVVYSAKSLRTKKGDFLKANYIFGFSLVYIIDLLLIALLLSFVVEQFSFVTFFQSSFQTAKFLFLDVFKQIFVLS